MPNPEPVSKIIYSFVFITTSYFIIKYFANDRVMNINEILNRNVTKTNMVYTLIYVILIAIINAMFNIKNANIICQNTSKGGAAAWYSLLPMLLIFGMLASLLIVMPSWKQPFSNTLGYALVSLPWINITSSMDKLFNGVRSSLLTKIYEDKSLLINEMTPENFNIFMEKTGSALNTGNLITRNEMSRIAGVSLFNAVVLKDMISQWCWYILTGILVILVTSNIIMDINCDSSSGVMSEYNKSIESAYEKTQKAIDEAGKKSQ